MSQLNPLASSRVILIIALALLAFGCGDVEEDEPYNITVGDTAFESDEEFKELTSTEQGEVCDWFIERLEIRWDACPIAPTPQACSHIIPTLDDCNATVRMRDLDRCRAGFEELACAEPPGIADGCSTVDLCLKGQFHASCGSDEVEHSFGDGRHCFKKCAHTRDCLESEACAEIDEQAEQTVCAPEDKVSTSDDEQYEAL